MNSVPFTKDPSQKGAALKLSSCDTDFNSTASLSGIRLKTNTVAVASLNNFQLEHSLLDQEDHEDDADFAKYRSDVCARSFKSDLCDDNDDESDCSPFNADDYSSSNSSWQSLGDDKHGLHEEQCALERISSSLKHPGIILNNCFRDRNRVSNGQRSVKFGTVTVRSISPNEKNRLAQQSVVEDRPSFDELHVATPYSKIDYTYDLRDYERIRRNRIRERNLQRQDFRKANHKKKPTKLVLVPGTS
jgi:hypothetical protein